MQEMILGCHTRGFFLYFCPLKQYDLIMKKYFSLMVLAAFCVVTLFSCKPDDEIYNRKCKISKIWYLSNVGDPNEVYQYDKKDMLTHIVIDSLETYDFEYNKDKTVSRIVHKGKHYTEKIEMTYTDRLVDKMVYSVNDTIRQEISFTRDEETTRITGIEEAYDKAFYDSFSILSKKSLYRKMVGDPEPVMKMMRENGAKDLVLHCKKTITYDPGEKEKYENIATVVEEYPEMRQEITRTYKYDPESFNPFYGMQYAYAGYAGYYLNNKLVETETIRTAGVITRETVFTYNYTGQHFMNDKKFPRQFTKTSSENNIPRNTYILYVK